MRNFKLVQLSFIIISIRQRYWLHTNGMGILNGLFQQISAGPGQKPKVQVMGLQARIFIFQTDRKIRPLIIVLTILDDSNN